MIMYQWQIYSGSWTNIAGATQSKYIPPTYGNYRCVATNIQGSQVISEAAVITRDWDFKFTVRIPRWAGAPSNLSYKLPTREYCGLGYALWPIVYDFTVNWGDGSTGTVTAWNSAALTHTYALAGDYTITISGIYEAFTLGWSRTLGIISMDEMRHPARMHSFDMLYERILTYIDPSFNKITGMQPMGMWCFAYACEKLEAIPDGLFDNYETTDISNCLVGCLSITTIPADLFKYQVKTTSFISCFNGAGITSIPADLFKYNINAEEFNHCFYYCEELTSIPATLFSHNTKVTTFEECFGGCTLLTSIPAALFTNCPEITDVSNCFESCESLTSIPAALFDNCPKITNVGGCFSYCTSLTAVPATLFAGCNKIGYYSSCFYYCTSLTGAAQPFIDAAEARAAAEGITLAKQGCFHNCTNLTDYATIPLAWRAGGAPRISINPANVTKAAGQTATFSVVAAEAESYQWQMKYNLPYADIPGATSASYTTPPVVFPSNKTYYRCKVTNLYGLTWSTEAWVAVTA